MQPPGPEEQPPALRRLWQILAAALLAWLAMTAFLALAQNSMTYFPSRADEATLAQLAADAGLEPWRDAAGYVIGYRSLAPAHDPRPRASVLVLHGNAGCAVDRAGFVPLLRTALPDKALSIHILEYPGYGARAGDPSQDSLLGAAAEAVSLAPAGEPLVLLGESIGSGVAAGVSARNPACIAGLVLLTPFDSLASVAQHHYPLLPVRLLMRDQYPAADWLRTLRNPAVFILAGNDEIVPAEFGQKLHDAYDGPKKLIIAPGAGHNDIVFRLGAVDWRAALSFVLP